MLITAGCYGGYGEAAARTRPEDNASAGRAGGVTSKNTPTGSQHHHAKEIEPVIEEVNAKQLERLLNDKDFVAVYWCKFLSSGVCTPKNQFQRNRNEIE